MSSSASGNAPLRPAASLGMMSNTYEANHYADELRQAARSGDAHAVDMLLADAAAHGGGSKVEVLGAADPHSGNTALHMAAANGHVDALRRLVVAGAPLDKRNDAGSTPLHYCAAGRNGECARVLADAGADLFVENGAGSTPMDDALRIGGGAGGDVAVVLMRAAEKSGADLGLDGDQVVGQDREEEQHGKQQQGEVHG